MTDFPASIDPRYLALGPMYGASIRVKPGSTITSFGGIDGVPIEPPIRLPAGGTVVMGNSNECIYQGLAVYIDNRRTAVYRLEEGRFICDVGVSDADTKDEQ